MSSALNSFVLFIMLHLCVHVNKCRDSKSSTAQGHREMLFKLFITPQNCAAGEGKAWC
jgi:hypothetical protein